MRARAQRGCSSYNDFVPREGMLKPRQMLQTWNLKGVDISKTRAVDLAVAKMDGGLIGIFLQLMSEELCKQPWGSWIPVWSLQRRSMMVWRARSGKRGQWGKGEKQWNPCCTDSLLGFYCWCWSLLALFRKRCFSAAFIETWKHHGVCICVAIAVFDDNALKGTRSCQVLGTLQDFHMKDINL